MSQQTDFNIPVDGYATFDALSMKELIKERLSENGFYTDQDFEGSNLSSLIDVLAYSYHVQMFYLNQTSSESLFTEAELYENVNRIVELLDYKPAGFQTCRLGFNLAAKSSVSKGAYAFPRYTHVSGNGLQYTIMQDMFISKYTAGEETIKDISKKYTLYQGIPQEYPIYHGKGTDFEKIILLPGDDVSIDHYTINVYVKDADTSKWEEWKQADNLYTHSQDSAVFEVRLNPKKRYEIKFGNNITGRSLKSGDSVAVYYLKSDGPKGKIGPNTINKSATLFSTPQFIDIWSDIKSDTTAYIDTTSLRGFDFSNQQFSTEFYEGETVTDIKNNAPKIFSAQNRVITKDDFETFIKYNFAGTVKSVKVVDNVSYLNGHVKYITDHLKMSKPESDVNTLYNHLLYADSTSFNNTYVYAVPVQTVTSSLVPRANYISTNLKNDIINYLANKKILTTDVTIVDPVYMAVAFGVRLSGEDFSPNIKDKTRLVVEKNSSSSLSNEGIVNSVYQILQEYFENSSLGQVLDLNSITSSILNIDGVDNIYTQRIDAPGVKLAGLSLLVWNSIYEEADIDVITSNVTLPYYKYPYLADALNITDKIVVQTAS